MSVSVAILDHCTESVRPLSKVGQARGVRMPGDESMLTRGSGSCSRRREDPPWPVVDNTSSESMWVKLLL